MPGACYTADISKGGGFIMKIGQFAGENNISVDTVRYYMELGLLVPHKKGGHYEFDENCINNLHEIFQLKEIGFSLQEIKILFYYKQFVKVENKISSKYYSEFFQKKLSHTKKTIENLNRNIEILERKLAKFKGEEGHSFRASGIELSSLKTLCCPWCGGELSLQKGIIEDNQVMEGRLSCSCEESLEVTDGILIIEKRSDSEEYSTGGSLNTDVELLFDFINNTDPIFLDKVYKSLSWYDHNLTQHDLAGKTVLDLGIGVGFFLRSIYDKLSHDTLYIAIDHDINALKLIKNIIDNSDSKKKTVFICTDFKVLPIKEQTIDLLIDYSGSTNYSFKHKDFLLDSMVKYLKNDSRLYGGYIIFDKFGKHNILELEYRDNFTGDYLKKKLHQSGFRLLHETCSERFYCKETSKYESYQQVGDVIYSYLCIMHFSKDK